MALEVKKSDTISNINEGEGTSPSCQRLFYNGRLLHEEDILSHYFIRSESTLDLMVCPPGAKVIYVQSRIYLTAGISDTVVDLLT